VDPTSSIGLWEGFGWGILGGLFAEVLGLYKLRHQTPEKLPLWLRSRFYWAVTCIMIFVGGLVVVIYMRSGFTVPAILAVNIGASAPLILGSVLGQAPRLEPGKTN